MQMACTADKQANYTAIKNIQKTVWASGDYARIGCTLQIVGECLAESMDVRSYQKILDVAAGNGNFTLAAARRWAEVTSTDYVDDFLLSGKKRAAAEGFTPEFQLADAECLPFVDESFDAVASTFGVMFAPDQSSAATEMVRVVRRGGKIGMANWTPNGFIGAILKVISAYAPPPVGIQSPVLWGTDVHIENLFGNDVNEIELRCKVFNFRYRSAEHWLEIFQQYYGPIQKAFSVLDSNGQKALAEDIKALIQSMNCSGDTSMLVPAEYLEIVITR